MAESSSESDTYLRGRGYRARGRDTQPRNRKGRANADEDISAKIDTLANTLQDTSRNLHNVDRMLGKYREHTDDQAEAMVTLREDLEDSIQQLRSQRQQRTSAGRSASVSTLHTSDLDAGSASDGHRHFPTSPLRDYSGPETTGRRRSRSATVRFTDAGTKDNYVHGLHQSLRDLRSDQIRLGDDVDREIHRRNRTEVETKRTLERLSESLASPQRAESVTSRVERRLQEIEKEIRSERRCAEKLPEPRGNMSQGLQQALRRREGAAGESEEAMKSSLLRSECEKNKVEQELERTRRLLDQSEGGRDTLLQQVEDLRVQLLRTEKERVDMQQQISLLSTQRSRQGCDEQERDRGSVERLELEREVQELRLQLGRGAVLSEMEELRRAVERKERERTQLCVQVEALSVDLERREQQQLKMLEQLKEIQARAEECQAERARAEAQRADSDRRREEVKSRAQEALRQWKAKCRKLELSLEEQSKEAQTSADKARKALKERDGLQVALQTLGQQAEALRKELAEVLGRLARREEDARRLEVELSEAKALRLGLEQEAREVREASRSLEEEAGRQGLLEARLREENRALEARAEEAGRGRERDRAALLELRAAARELSEARAQLAARLAEEEEAREEAQRRLDAALEEARAQGRQLQLERELRQSELASLQGALQDGRAKQERAVQETLRLCHQEKKELQDHLRELKAEGAADKDKVRAHRRQVEKMKAECDKLTEELTRAEEGHAQLGRKCQLLKQELEEKTKLAARGDDRARSAEGAAAELRAHVSRLEAEQESVLSSIGAEIDAACKELSGDSAEKLKAISLSLGLHSDPHRWLAETKTKLQWLCEEVKEREARARRLRRHVQQSREEIKSLKKSKEAEQQVLLERITQQERLLENLHDLLEKTHMKDEEMRGLQDRISDLETSTRLALDHLESVPEKLSLLENFKDLEESQRQREVVEERYARYKDIVGDLQHQLEESKRRIQDSRDEKMDAASRSIRLAALSSSIRGQGNFLSSSLLSDSASPHKRFASPELDSSLLEDQSLSLNGIKPLSTAQ
ncbi:centrosomal protein of 128 kDa-like isoform X2 [Anguilla anguilla]|uniref:centrosomal protein of 128 kDa-like isoform X2 n=1 Tax=Anguilla anguilla TaxID=7936 RepID=UPI0015AA5D3C|nr:centrosomal protein of 128 kDa-like isoform X2 [Anguilla anguilla]